MYKVFFVEDEVILRNGIRQNIKWEDTNFIFTGDAADGEEALPLIRKAKPDILITDIKMPFMDGLELSRIIKNEMPDTKIIILTGYDEFDFARESLSIGVSEYLLKPFSSSRLIEVLEKVGSDIKSEKLNKIRDYEKYVLEKNWANSQDNKSKSSTADELYKYDSDLINDFIKVGTLNEINDFLDEYIKRLGDSALRSYLYTYYSFMNIVLISSKFIKELGGDINIIIPETKELENLCLNLDSIEDLKKYIKKVITAVIAFRDNKKLNKYADVILDAKNYIYKNYSNSRISLDSVAAFVSMSPNHFSMIFKQETGESFIDFLTSVRIKKAMEILQTSNLRSSAIASAVGYPDPHYFSHLFKKIVKCTPTEFRNRK